jgi:hypothetical protein
MQQAVPDLTSPRVCLSPGGAHLSGLNKLFFGYSILGESVLGPVLSHCHRIGQEHPGRPKLGLLVLLAALYKVHWSLLKSDICFLFSDAPKQSLRVVFQPWVIWWLIVQIHHKVAQFVGHGRLLNLYFGSSQTDVWLPRYGHFKFWGGVVHKN